MLPFASLPTDLDAAHHPQFLSAEKADKLFAELRDALAWQQQPITMFGRTMMQPRLIAWYGDEGAVYTYSRQRQEPREWTPELIAIKQQIEQFSGARFNSVLANYYRDGQDSMGWHSDDEPELGPEPVIASLSLGQPRDFLFREKNSHSPRRHKITLQHGSLLIMHGNNQQKWQHCLPKRADVGGGRINLTFRWVMTARQG